LSQARFLARRLRGQLRVWVFDDDRRAVVKGKSLTIDEVVRPHMRQSRFLVDIYRDRGKESVASDEEPNRL
jgi:hypothetical protein